MLDVRGTDQWMDMNIWKIIPQRSCCLQRNSLRSGWHSSGKQRRWGLKSPHTVGGRQGRGDVSRLVHALICISPLCRMADLSKWVFVLFLESPCILVCLSSCLYSGYRDLVPGGNTIYWLLVQDTPVPATHWRMDSQGHLG